MTPRRRRPALLLLSILLLVAAGAVLAEVAPPLALCASSEDGSNETSTSSTTCGGAAVVHPPPSATASSGYVDCVSPGASVDARCVAGALSASVSARSVDGEGVEKLETDPAAAFTFPPADTGAVLAACPDSPLLPDALGTDGNTDLTGLPTQEALDAAAEQISACVSALRADPDALACFYPCDYTAWRASALAPPKAPLQTSPALSSAAGRHARDMASSATFSHAGSDASSVASRIADAGFTTFPLGENIAAGYASVRAVSLAWACSAGHRANLLACGFDAAGSGAAVALGTPYTIYFAQEFGCTRPEYDCTCRAGPVDLDPSTLPPLPTCPDGPAWTPAPAAGGGALVGSQPTAATVAVAVPAPEATLEPTATPTPEPTALFSEAAPAPTETDVVVVEEGEEGAEAEVGEEEAPPLPASTPPPPPTSTLAPPAPRLPLPPCPAATSGSADPSGCLFAAGPGLLSSSASSSSSSSSRGSGGLPSAAGDGGSVLVAWAPGCGGGGGRNGAAPSPPPASLAATLEGATGASAPATAIVTPMGELPGRPGTLLAAVATPPGWSGRVTVRVGGEGGGELGARAPSTLSYTVEGAGGPVPARRAVTVTGVGLGGAAVVEAPA